MNAHKLYAQDADFRTLMEQWVADHKCPLVMADYLRDNGLDGQAHCAELYAWGTPPQYVCGCGNVWFNYLLFDGLLNDRITSSNPFSKGAKLTCFLTPYSPFPTYKYYAFFNTEVEALLGLLDGWADALAAGMELPMAQVGVMG